MVLKGRAHRFQPNDDINTDYIISGRYKFRIDDVSELAKHVMEDISPGFADSVSPGDFIVAGRNFGCGSSREQAPRALMAAGVSAVIAKSYARIFYRSSFNIGLPLIEMDTDWIADGDELAVDLSAGVVKELSSGIDRSMRALPVTMRTLLDDGGLVPHVQKNGGFRL
ncbi:MAG: 3-isopropylmalate dehydratase [Thermoplasmata archaeon]|jgi:3-isopropylmalate/(R)-2-methylmalate dehydratase small subunit|nr:3-isopropylmalate dehydratase [Thermoplasmata archaeon]